MPEIEEQEFLFKFKEEAEEHLQGLNCGLLELEGNPRNKDTVNELLRLAHTLKGAARMVGLTEIGELAHRIETTFQKVRDEGITLSSSEISDLFHSFDEIKELMERELGEEKRAEPSDVHSLPEGERQSEDAGPVKLKDPKEIRIAPNPSVCSLGVGDTGSKKENERLFGRRLEDRQETIRVKTQRLDRLGSLTSEMIIHHSQIQQDQRKLEEAYRKSKEGLKLLGFLGDRLQDSSIPLLHRDALLEELKQTQNCYVDFGNSLHRLCKSLAEKFARVNAATQDLQQEVLDVRMLPISIVFDDLPRAVRDMSYLCGKLVTLRITGRDTELDKRMLEGLRDPIIHLVRNAVDHGMETVEERVKMGKPREGLIQISAWHQGDKVVVEVRDDGPGIDWEEVRQTAARKGLVAPENMDALKDHELTSFLFMPGFSTSELVTELSGRGVGLDVVRQKVEELKGMMSVSSETGKGSAVKLELPLTLAVQRVLLVEVGTQVLALPTASVEETLTLRLEQIRSVEGRQAVTIREKIVPLVSLAKVLGLNGFSDWEEKRLFIVVVSWGNQQIAFVTDKLLGEQEVVVKSLGNHLRRVKNVAGATILGNGRVTVILSVPDLLESARSSPGFSPPELRPVPQRADRRSILVVEDSLTAREMERSILEASGYRVDVASDGVEALEKATGKTYDLFVVDIQMPRMDGFQLTERLRQNGTYKEVPIVMVTSRDKEEDKKRGKDLGANAYITKRQFDQSILVDTVGRLIG
jgi:chemotaxis protein histidine kinase CheA/CheY-like chemotaxis protein